jgi:hypothetical protein
MTPKRVYSFMIDPELADALKQLKERDGIAEGEQIRRALQSWFKTKGVKVKSERKQAGTRKRS